MEMSSTQQAATSAMNAAAGNNGVGQPHLHYNVGGGGNNSHNWGAGSNVGVGTKVWESANQNHAIGVGVNHGQSFGRHNGQNWKSRPDVGAGVGYRFNFGKK